MQAELRQLRFKAESLGRCLVSPRTAPLAAFTTGLSAAATPGAQGSASLEGMQRPARQGQP